ncbi:lipoprotein-releasing ABC transporter permease subunit LolE [Dongshaea marina]|uniref:lipoprotein-releasing ABC transporter permease subunit LolE n=1 Tax=Dongshaea marina TaxID=2047966 RepID=UPI000D3E9AFA|nr:lipoprotein-releasing ABC transporter permease subunit LolE [Dongshaea marina]
MSPSLIFRLGLRFSRLRGKSGFTQFIARSSVLGIALGVMVLIVCLSAMNGFEKELRQRVLMVIPQGELQAMAPPIGNWQPLMKQLAAKPGITAVAPDIKLNGLLQNGAKLKAVQLRAVLPQDEQGISDAGHFMSGKGWQALKPGADDLILGAGIAHKLKLKVGDYVTLLLPQMGENSSRILSPKTVRFRVAGLLSIGGQLDNLLGFIHLKDAQRLLGWQDKIQGFTLRVNNIFEAEQLTKQAAMGLGVPFYVSSWMNAQGYLYQDIQMVRTILYLIMLLLVAVACFNIVSTLVMAVNDKRSEIAILRTLGLTQWRIRVTFMVLGMVNGIIGCVIGVGLGVLFSWYLTPLSSAFQHLINHQFLNPDIYFIDFIPSQLHLGDVAIVSGCVLLMSLIATLYPAFLASTVEPAQELGRV